MAPSDDPIDGVPLQPPQPDKDCPAAAYAFDVIANLDADGNPDPTTAAACMRHAARGVQDSCQHSHSDTCKRHGCAGDDSSCGMVFPRLLRFVFQWVGTTGLFLLPRFGKYIVPYMPAIAMAFGCNHLFSLACELDRDFTLEEAARLANPDGEPSKLLAPATDRARDNSIYVTKYIAKNVSKSQTERLIKSLQFVEGYFLEPPPGSPEDAGRQGIRNIMAAVNRLTTSVTAGMALIAYKLVGHKTFEMTYDTAPLVCGAFTSLVAAHPGATGADDQSNGDASASLIQEPDGSAVRVVTVVDEYRLRGADLDGVETSPYMMTMLYEVRAVSVRQHPHADRITSLMRVPTRHRTRATTTAATDETNDVPDFEVDDESAHEGLASESDVEDDAALGTATAADEEHVTHETGGVSSRLPTHLRSAVIVFVSAFPNCLHVSCACRSLTALMVTSR